DTTDRRIDGETQENPADDRVTSHAEEERQHPHEGPGGDGGTPEVDERRSRDLAHHPAHHHQHDRQPRGPPDREPARHQREDHAEHERGESDRDQVDYTDPHGVPEVPGHRPEEEADALGADREDEGATQDLETSSGVYRVE